jgi:hypothetical protein
VTTQTSQSDELDRLFRRLVSNLADLDPSRLSRAFAVSEIYESLVPYRTHRVVLGIDTNEDYEMAVLRLLSGERGYAMVEPGDVMEALAKEAASKNPDTGLFRRFGAARVTLDAALVGDALGSATDLHPEPQVEEEPQAPVRPREEPEPEQPPAVEEEAQASLPFVLAEEEDEEEEARPMARPRSAQTASPCPYCGGELPIGRAVLFCPHCGQHVGVVHCPTCDTELDVGWRFCITCGQKVAGIG